MTLNVLLHKYVCSYILLGHRENQTIKQRDLLWKEQWNWPSLLPSEEEEFHLFVQNCILQYNSFVQMQNFVQIQNFAQSYNFVQEPLIEVWSGCGITLDAQSAVSHIMWWKIFGLHFKLTHCVTVKNANEYSKMCATLWSEWWGVDTTWPTKRQIN